MPPLLTEVAYFSPPFCYWLEGKNNDAESERLCLDKFQGFLLAPVSEDTLSAPQNDRKDHEPIFIDEVQLCQHVHQLATPENQQVLTDLVLESGHRFREIALDQAGIPLHLSEGRGSHILGHAVDALTIFPGPLHIRPSGGKALIGHSSQQKRIARKELLEFILLLFFAP